MWYCQQDGDLIRNISGIEDGKLTESKWKQIEPKNVGKRNFIPAHRQAEKEIEALYAKQIKKHGYWRNRSEIDNAAAYIKPMLAEHLKDNPIADPNEGWFIQPKFDGYRCIAEPTRSTSKHGEVFATTEHITEALQGSFRPEIRAFDGELYNHEFKEDFNTISSLIAKKKPTRDELNRVFDLLQYHVYDFVPNPGYEHLTYRERFAILQEVFKPLDNSLLLHLTKCEYVVADTLEELKDKIEQHRLWCTVEQGYEGQMLRRAKSVYQIDYRTTDLLKNKVRIDREYVVEDILEGKGNGAGLAKKAVFTNELGHKFRAGINGNNAFTAQILKDKHLYIGGDATVEFFSYTPGKKVPRFGKVTKFYEGSRKF
ncbi:ATP-dependent DNA ligase protein [Rhizobium phage RHph_I1_18]|nr:ATP-dependent DNA ligase protein [Rhizobium phage RHph_I1_18]